MKDLMQQINDGKVSAVVRRFSWICSPYFVSSFLKSSQNSSFCLNCLLCWSYSVLGRVTGKRTYKGLTEAGFYRPDALPVTNRVKALYLQHDRLNIVV